MNTKELLLDNDRVIIDLDSTGNDLKPGDMYVGMWNQYCREFIKFCHDINTSANPCLSYPDGYPLLTCKEIRKDKKYVIPEEDGYYFDLCQCRKVVDIIK